jgi:SAM-dependent methyltransferase
MTPSAIELYDRVVEDPALALRARRTDGRVVRLGLDRWLGPLTLADEAVLDRASAPVLDVGCGPGRHVIGLARRGHLAVGVEVAPAAVRLARSRGAQVVEASVFSRLPGAGTWGCALLLDGNIGIGGTPAALLARLRELLRPDGEVLVELAAPGVAVTSERLRLELDGRLSRSFPWAYVGFQAIDDPARAAGFDVAERWCAEGRWFARLAVTCARGRQGRIA